MRSCLSISSGLPNHQIHQIQESWKVLFCTSPVLWSCVSMSSTSSDGILGGKTQNIRAYPLPTRVFCWAWLEREAKVPTLLKTPRCKALGSACWHFGILKSSIHTLIWNSSFCQPFRLDSKLVNWEKSTLGWAQHLRNGAKGGEEEKSHVEQLHNQLVFQIKQTISSWCKNVDQLKQYWSK